MLLLLCLLAAIDLLKGGHIVLIRALVNARGRLEHDAYRLVPGIIQVLRSIVTVRETGAGMLFAFTSVRCGAALRHRASMDLEAFRLPLLGCAAAMVEGQRALRGVANLVPVSCRQVRLESWLFWGR